MDVKKKTISDMFIKWKEEDDKIQFVVLFLFSMGFMGF